MNVFSDYDYYYQQQFQQQQQIQQVNNMDRIPYKLNEVLYPDPNKVLHSSEYSNAPYQVYNLDPNSQNNGFYLYKPIESVTEYITELEPNLNNEIETILKKNSEVWAAYESGRFDVTDTVENGVRKIVLKEKGTDGNESDFTIRKYRVTLTNRRRRHKKTDDHVLLVSFSNSSLNNTNTMTHSNRVSNKLSSAAPMLTSQSVHKTPTPAIMVGNSAPDNEQLSIDYNNDIDADAYLSGPGSDLINKIINGDDSFEFSDEDPHSIAAKLSYPEARQNKSLTKEAPTMSEQSEESHESQPDSFDDEYIETYAPPQKPSLVSAAEMVALSPAISRRSDSRRTVDQYTPSSRYSQVSPRPSNMHVNDAYGQSRLSQNSETTSYSQNTPVNVDYMSGGTVNSSRLSGNIRPSKTSYHHQQPIHQQTPQPTVRDTPVSLAAQSASISLRDIGPTTPSRLSTLNYTSEEVVKTPVTASSIRAGSRGSSTAAIPTNYETNQDTQSIGPGSLAGGSLFGGFIPSNFETESQIQHDKSAFSEYTLSRNEAEQSVTNQILKDLMDMAEADRKSQNSLLRPNSANSLVRVSPTKSRILSRQSGMRSPRQSTVQTVSPPPVELRLGSINSRQSTNLTNFNSTVPQLETATNTTTTGSRLTHTQNSRLSGIKASPRQSSHISKTPTEIRMGSRQSVNGQLVSNQILQDLLDLADADARRSQTSLRIGSRQSGVN